MDSKNGSAAITRMGEELANILWYLRLEAPGRPMMRKGLNAVMDAVGAEGVAVVRAVLDEACERLYRAGAVGTASGMTATLLRKAKIGVPAIGRDTDNRLMAAAICQQSAGATLGLVLWRQHDAPDWSDEDIKLVDATAGIVRLLLDREASRADRASTTRIDPVTTLLNRRSFIAAASRHISRLARDDLPGTLMLAEIDNLQSIGAKGGTQVGNQMLRRAAVLLQSTVRPSDLVGRIGDDEFAVWLSGADHLTAAERADALCQEAPRWIAGPDNANLPDASFSIGIATWRPSESFEDVARRAKQAMREVKAAGGGYWLVSLGHAA